MITIKADKQYDEVINKYANHFTLGGFSNLNKSDLGKASRNSFQKTGLYGEVYWSIYRYGSIDKLVALLDKKVEVLVPLFGTSASRGDGGEDDSITSNGRTRLVDIKTSHCENKERIQYLNLVIPERELHKNMVYVAAFTIGKTREAVDEVVLAGWCVSEDITKRWGVDPKKWCVPTKDLRDMSELEEHIR